MEIFITNLGEMSQHNFEVFINHGVFNKNGSFFSPDHWIFIECHSTLSKHLNDKLQKKKKIYFM